MKTIRAGTGNQGREGKDNRNGVRQDETLFTFQNKTGNTTIQTLMFIALSLTNKPINK